jgi:hypothetical protein
MTFLHDESYLWWTCRPLWTGSLGKKCIGSPPELSSDWKTRVLTMISLIFKALRDFPNSPGGMARPRDAAGGV